MGLMDLFGDSSGSEERKLPEQILWLNDAPMFIDDKQVEAFYDAILQPDFEEISQNFSDSISTETGIEGGLTLGAVLPWFAKAEATAKASRKKGKEKGRTATWNKVANPYRHLLAMALQYATEDQLRSRLILASDDRCVDSNGAPADLGNDEILLKGPRPLVMLDLTAGAKFIPTALELTSGKVERVFMDLAKRLSHPDGKELPPFPHGPGLEAKQRTYWQWFAEAFEKQVVLEAVEDAAEKASIAWIDYRFPLAGRFPHLHLDARSRYATGVFAYQLISRGFEHGLRIVGTLKSEPDINVLAIFER